MTAAHNASPAKRREDTLRRELARVQKSADRLMTAYQEDLLSLDDLRRRMPELRKREQAIGGELSAVQISLPIAPDTCDWRRRSQAFLRGYTRPRRR